ncbi:dolichyl-P-Glc:Man9GlcNAc2-PP-dolichyl glucosyltransferase [Nitzschia inconspicua]|uniref:Alpha-1,3-glucosyltransferase n=1 Tax=Nitzschia inconspicua TaxID=303405 RepID=A0A9K3PTH9_9STRA|nr:dolichyl-P-Glc:Man9GlcNAc2-PP-dolichyl glucosyltransferase [Nitzschia inconspicua]
MSSDRAATPQQHRRHGQHPQQGTNAQMDALPKDPRMLHDDHERQHLHHMTPSRRNVLSSSPSSSSSSGLPTFLGHPRKVLPPLLVLLTCIKLLLLPSSVYRSTDFDVHRNWLAITKQLPLSEWYFDDVQGGTVHTLDYPPGFAFFEYLWSHSPLTSLLLPTDDRCLELLPDNDNAPSDACVLFQRLTVIISDVILWMGAYACCHAMHPTQTPIAVVSFLLIVFNPALLWLDHVHFQYNGMLLGILLASMACLIMGNNVCNTSTWAYNIYHLAGAALFALLLNLKHLYLALAPLYFCYLLERYCLTSTDANGVTTKRFLFGKFFVLALVTAITLVLPWIPFVLVDTNYPQRQLLQILSRLFPFGRGLVHDYWAANVWALYTFTNKVLRFVVTKLPMPVAAYVQDWYLPEPSPLICAILLFLSIIPGMQVASARLSNVKLVEAVVYVSFCSFMLSYHVHEKAILTTLIPLTLLVGPGGHRYEIHNILFWHTTVWGLLGLFPLLYRPVELSLKLFSYVGYLGLAAELLQTPPKWTYEIEFSTFVTVAAVIVLLEFVPVWGKWEFLPLMVTSIACAFGLLGCWGMSLRLLITEERKHVGSPSN